MIPAALLVSAPGSGAVWRIVENQEQAATRRITRSAQAQSRLEQLLDASKPPYMPGSEKLHWLLKTPFRYPPLRHGSRFGSAMQPGILYASRQLATAMTESAVYLWLFRAAPTRLGPLERICDGRTALHFNVAHPRMGDLTSSPARDYRQRICDPASYAFSQTLGAALREAGVGAFWFYSARAAAGVNCAVTDPAAIDGSAQPRQEHWRLQLDADTCWWGRPGRPSFEVHYSSVADASGKIPHPAL